MAKNSIVKYVGLVEKLEEFQERNGYPPSIREFAILAGTRSTSVANYYLDRLVTLGMIEREPGISRGIRLVKKAPKAPVLTAQQFMPLAKRRFRAGLAAAGVRKRQEWLRQPVAQ